MIIIEEFFPNPIGKDTEGEWIKLFNNNDVAVNLSGWQIKDASGKAFIFSTTNKNIIVGGETLTLDYKTTKIAINNNGETIFLYDNLGNLIDKAEYVGIAGDGEIFIRTSNGKFIINNKSDNVIKEEINSMNISEPVFQGNFNPVIITNNNSSLFGFSMGIFIVLILSVFFIFISKKLNLFSDDTN